MLVPDGVVPLGDAELPRPAGHGVLVQGELDHPAAPGAPPGCRGAPAAELGDPPCRHGPEPCPEALAAPGPAPSGEPAQAGVLGGFQVEDPADAHQGEPEAVEQSPGGHPAPGRRLGPAPVGEGACGEAGQGERLGDQEEGAGMLGAEGASSAPFFRCPQGRSSVSRPRRRRAG